MSRWESELREANLPRDQVSIIIHNLEKIEEAGISSSKISIIVHNIVKDTGFKDAFISDYKKAAERVGIIIHN